MAENNNERGFRHPEWYFEALRGAGLLEERGKLDEAERVRHLANLALAAHIGANIKDSHGNPVLGENEGSQAEALRQRI